jgi:hypothetical protein
LVCNVVPEPAAAVVDAAVLVDAVVLGVDVAAVEAGVEAAFELLLELLEPHPASSATAAAAAAAKPRGRVTVASCLGSTRAAGRLALTPQTRSRAESSRRR